MNLHGFKFFIFINNILFIGAVSFYFNETYNEYTLIMPLADDDTRGPLTLRSSFAENWCSNINATLPRITDETEQKNIVDFIRNATQIYTFDRIQTIFVNNIHHHTVGNWTWVNGQKSQGFAVRATYSTEAFFGYLPTDYLIYPSLPNATRRYICEASKPSNNFSRCDMKLDNRCYWKKYIPLTWHKARNVCLKEGGDFASFDAVNITGLKDSQKDLGLSAVYAVKGYWIGLSQSVWRWKDKDIDSEIKYSNWKLNHSFNYNAKCLCLDKSNSYEWIGCDCDKEYPFICKRNVISDTLAQSRPTDQMPSHLVVSGTVQLALILSACALNVVNLVFSVFIIRRQRNSSVNSSHNESPDAKRASTTNEVSVYEEFQESRKNNATYVALQRSI